MADYDRRDAGTFCWLDLAAHDAEGAKRFYTTLFGWTANDMKYGEGEGEVYTMYALRGRHVAASYPMDPGQKEMGFPPAWLSYVAVDDADEAVRRATELGATVLGEPFDVLDSGRMGLIQDPAGAMLGLWQARGHKGFGVYDEPGAVVWFELGTHDPDAAEAFYTALFGWSARKQDMGMPYTTFLKGEQMVGGMYGMPPEMAGMPANWSPYFWVEDPDGDAERARELGATVLTGPTDIPTVGRFVALRDPQGAMFSIIRMGAASS
jgi:predicted enzyme related to lactoylglutathione lyase